MYHNVHSSISQFLIIALFIVSTSVTTVINSSVYVLIYRSVKIRCSPILLDSQVQELLI